MLLVRRRSWNRKCWCHEKKREVISKDVSLSRHRSFCRRRDIIVNEGVEDFADVRVLRFRLWRNINFLCVTLLLAFVALSSSLPLVDDHESTKIHIRILSLGSKGTVWRNKKTQDDLWRTRRNRDVNAVVAAGGRTASTLSWGAKSRSSIQENRRKRLADSFAHDSLSFGVETCLLSFCWRLRQSLLEFVWVLSLFFSHRLSKFEGLELNGVFGPAVSHSVSASFLSLLVRSLCLSYFASFFPSFLILFSVWCLPLLSALKRQGM